MSSVVSFMFGGAFVVVLRMMLRGESFWDGLIGGVTCLGLLVGLVFQYSDERELRRLAAVGAKKVLEE